MSCRECEIYQTCCDAYATAKPVDVLFVQDVVKTYNGVHGYKTETMTKLRQSLRKVYASGMSVEYVNLVNYMLPDGKKPVKKDITACGKYTLRFIDKCKPTYIVALGAAVFTALTGKSQFKKWVGRTVEHEGYTVIPMFHPDYAAKNKAREREYDAQLKNITNQLLGNHSVLDDSRYQLLTGENEILYCLDSLIHEFPDHVQSFDYETTGLIPEDGLPVCLSVSYEHGQAYCFYFFDRDEYEQHGTNSKLTKKIKAKVREWMESDVPKVAQNAKFEIKWTIRHFGCEPNNIVGDTKQIHHLLHEASDSHLSNLAYQYTDMGGYDTPMVEFLAEHGDGSHWKADPEDMRIYSCGDSDCTRRIYIEQIEQLFKDEGLKWLYRNIVNPSVYTLARIEERGMQIDVEKLVEVQQDLTDRIAATRAELDEMPEVRRTLARFKKKNKKLTEVNFGSSPQMQHLLYNECKLPVLKTSKKSKNPSTESSVLDKLKSKHKVVQLICDIRSYTYQLGDIDQIADRLSTEETVFSDLVQDYVVTGRLSSRSPNLQNIKGGTDEAPSLVKECFVSRFEGGQLMQADFSQLELRLVGSESGEPKFIRAFEDGTDMHSLTGSEINNVPLEEFEAGKNDKYKKLRTYAKRINFGSVYGITEHGLANQLDCTEKEAKKQLDAYWASYSVIKAWTRRNVREAQETLQVRNRLGRIRHLPDITSNQWWKRESAERQSSNFKIQSLGADINMWSMTTVDQLLLKHGYRSMVIGQIHDSVLLDVHPDEHDDIIALVKWVMTEKLMRLFSFLRIPLKVDVEAGARWSEMKPVA